MKTRYVLLPFSTDEKVKALRDWDFWGPLCFCLLLTALIAFGNTQSDTSVIFGSVYSVIFGGAMIIGLNSSLCGCPGSIFLTASMLGYCLAPFLIAALINLLLRSVIMFIGVVLVTAVCYLWALKSSSMFATANCKPKRKWMVLYPIMLYYLFFAFFIALS